MLQGILCGFQGAVYSQRDDKGVGVSRARQNVWDRSRGMRLSDLQERWLVDVPNRMPPPNVAVLEAIYSAAQNDGLSDPLKPP
jgi:hypothetical protein